MTKVTLEVNGKKVSKEVPDHTLLSVFLRDNFKQGSVLICGSLYLAGHVLKENKYKII